RGADPKFPGYHQRYPYAQDAYQHDELEPVMHKDASGKLIPGELQSKGPGVVVVHPYRNIIWNCCHHTLLEFPDPTSMAAEIPGMAEAAAAGGLAGAAGEAGGSFLDGSGSVGGDSGFRELSDDDDEGWVSNTAKGTLRSETKNAGNLLPQDGE